MQLEYKYVVRSCDGGVLCWKPGENCQIRLPVWLKEEKAIAEGVLVRDAWDGSIQDVELEVTGFRRQDFTEEEEMAAVQSAVSSAAEVMGLCHTFQKPGVSGQALRSGQVVRNCC